MRLRASLGNSRSFTFVRRKRARNIVPLLEKADRSYIIKTNNPAFRRNPFQTGLQSRPRRAARKDHLSPIRERQTDKPRFRIYWAYIRGKGVEYGDSTGVQIGKQPGGEAAEGIPGKKQRAGNFSAR